MKSLARSHVWLPGIDKDIGQITKSCQACQSVKQAPSAAPLQPWTCPAKPWQRVYIVHLFCRPLSKQNLLFSSGCSLKVAGGLWNAVNNNFKILRHLFSNNGSLKNSWHQAYQVIPIPSLFKWCYRMLRAYFFNRPWRLVNEMDFLTPKFSPHSQVNTSCHFSSTTQYSVLRKKHSNPTWPIAPRHIQACLCKASTTEERSWLTHTREDLVEGQVWNFPSGASWIPATIVRRQGPLTFNVVIENGQVWKRRAD